MSRLVDSWRNERGLLVVVSLGTSNRRATLKKRVEIAPEESHKLARWFERPETTRTHLPFEIAGRTPDIASCLLLR
jgi:hypothetical protein